MPSLTFFFNSLFRAYSPFLPLLLSWAFYLVGILLYYTFYLTSSPRVGTIQFIHKCAYTHTVRTLYLVSCGINASLWHGDTLPAFLLSPGFRFTGLASYFVYCARDNKRLVHIPWMGFAADLLRSFNVVTQMPYLLGDQPLSMLENKVIIVTFDSSKRTYIPNPEQGTASATLIFIPDVSVTKWK